MAITTVDGIIAGSRPPTHFFKVGTTMEAAGVMHTFFYNTGRPGAAAANANALAGAALTTYAGQLPYTNPSSGNAYIQSLSCSSTAIGTLILIDRLWHNDSIAETTTTGQTITSATWPARDENASTNGEGIMVGIEVSTATTNGSAVTNTTLTYTNQSGTGSKTATISSFPATAVAGTFVPFQLAAGDTGVRSIQTLTLGTSYGGGTIHLVAYRVLARVPCLVANSASSIDPVSSSFTRCFDNTVPQLLFMPSATTAVTVHGELVFTHG